MAALELRTLASELDKTCADSLQQRVTRQNEAIQSLVDERTTHLEIIAGLKGTFARLKTRVKDLVVENANLRVILIDYVEVLKGVRRRQDKLTAEELDTMKAFEEVHNRALTRAAARRKDNVNEARKSDNSSSLLKIKSLNRNESILSTVSEDSEGPTEFSADSTTDFKNRTELSDVTILTQSSSLPRIRSKTSHPYVKFFKALPLFAIFPEDMITQVAFASYEMKRKLGHIIVSKGEEAAEMFFLLRGNAQVLVDGKIVSTLNPGTFFGELGVLFKMNRTATVLAKTACTLAVITKQKLDEIIATDPEIRARVNDFSASKEAWWKEQQYVESQEKFGAEFANEIGRKEIKKIDLFSKTSNAVLDQLAMKMKSVVFTKNYLIISTGQESDAMYFILSGSVEVVGPTGDVHAEMTAGSFFGEVGLLMNMQRTASVRAKQECLIFKLWKSDLDFVLGEHEEIQTAIKKAVDERYELYKKRTTPLLATKSIDQIPDQFDMEVGVQALRKISIFRNIDKSFLQELSMALTRKNWNKGDMIITAEQYGDSMYFLAAGQVEVMTSFGEVIDNVSGPSAYFGEVAVIEAIPRTASVKCVSQCSTYELKRADLQLVVKQYPDIAEHVRATAEARLQQHLMRNVLA